MTREQRMQKVRDHITKVEEVRKEQAAKRQLSRGEDAAGVGEKVGPCLKKREEQLRAGEDHCPQVH